MTLPTLSEVRRGLTMSRLRDLAYAATRATQGRWGAFGTSLLVDETGAANADTATPIGYFTTVDDHGRPQTFDLDYAVAFQPLTGHALVEEVLALREANRDLADALRLTQEYVGGETLPAVEGWGWFDALSKHAPEMLPAALNGAIDCAQEHVHAQPVDEPVNDARAALARLTHPDRVRDRIEASRQGGVNALLPPLHPEGAEMEAPASTGDQFVASDGLARLRAEWEADTPRREAAERVIAYLVALDGFYGDEAPDDRIDTADGSPDSPELLLSDLRTLVGIPNPEET